MLLEHELTWHFRGFLSHKSGHFILYLFIFFFCCCFVFRHFVCSTNPLQIHYSFWFGYLLWDFSMWEHVYQWSCLLFFWFCCFIIFLFFIFNWSYLFYYFFIIAQMPVFFLRSNRKCMNPDGKEGGKEVEEETIIKIYCLKENHFLIK